MAAVGLQSRFRVVPEHDRIGKPRIVPEIVGVNLRHSAQSRIGISSRVRGRMKDAAHRRKTHDRLELGPLADHLHGAAMSQHGVMHRQEHLGHAQLQSRRMLAGQVPHAEEALRLIQRHPVRDAIGKTIHHEAGIVLKPRRAVGIQPAATQEKVIRIIPVKKRGPRLQARIEHAIDDAVVEIEALLVDRASPAGMTRGQEMEKR